MRRETACGSACASCGASSSCAYKNVVTAAAVNRAGAGVGDTVTVSTGTSRIIGAAALVYILPLALFLAGYAAAVLLKLTETAAILASLGAFAVGVLLTAVIGRRRAVKFEIIDVVRRE